MKGHDVTEIVNQFNNDSITSDEMWDKIFEKIKKYFHKIIWKSEIGFVYLPCK